MQVRTRHTPAFGVARLVLAPGEAVQAESTAMLATSYGVHVEQRSRGGRARSKPALFTAGPEGGWVDLAPAFPGDVHTIEMDGSAGWCVSRGSWLAVTATLRADSQWQGFHTLFGAEHGFLEHVSGSGTLVLACCGALDQTTLGVGEFITVDPAHLLAYSDGAQARLRAMAQSGSQSVRTGEGLLLDFAGPGTVLTQTRTPRALAALLAR
ncbi:AIM24 family protein [Actinokineospora pegani]|uniref:AIM24 family protein n=1 Tax=Actinokineospora pegani TaxID=2654637 RepID=UPI0012E99C01|nr:AIM24 family protein [Actinokineospora pegani]